jgi:5-methylcytosine-specific restriction endonuclease McrA
MNETKQCTGCGETKDLALFPHDPRVKDGRAARCKACKYLQTSAWARRNSTRRNARARELSKLPSYRKVISNRTSRFKRRHPDYKKKHDVLRRARFGKIVADLTDEQWQAIKEFYCHCCAYCGKRPDKLTIDHVVPIVKGGHHTASNIVPACATCNHRKHARDWLPKVMHAVGPSQAMTDCG